MASIKIICTTLLVEKSPQALPLGAACIASALKSDSNLRELCDIELLAFSHESDFLKNIPKHDSKKIAELLSEKLIQNFKGNYDIRFCLFSVFVWNKDIFDITSNILKKHNIITIAGGPEITAHPDDIRSFDYISTGEGEQKIPFLIKQILKSNKTIDITLNDDQNTDCKNQNTNYPSPYLDGTLNLNEYHGALWELARGCPFKCSYCYESKGEKTVRYFPLERIEKELDLFAKENIPQVFVLDPTYNANKQRAIQLINLIAKKTPNTFYHFEARAEFIDKQLAQAFTKIPCSLQIGLQSANEESLKLVNRPMNKKQFIKNINALNECGVIFGFDLIYGLPKETLKSFLDGIDFALSLYPNHLEIFRLSVLPGTDLFDRAKELGLTYETNPPYHIIKTESFSQNELNIAELYAKTCSLFYNEGRAVPWFNTICHCLKIKPSALFKKFYDKHKNLIERFDCTALDKMSHKKIEELQLDFVVEQLKQKKLDRYTKLATDLIKLNGAYSRKIAEGKHHIAEKINLNYPIEFLDSPYSSNMEFFIKNVKPKNSTIRI